MCAGLYPESVVKDRDIFTRVRWRTEQKAVESRAFAAVGAWKVGTVCA